MGDIVQSRTARVGSFREDLDAWTSIPSKYHIEVFNHAKTRIHMRCCDLLLEKTTMSLVNLRVSTMGGVPEHPDGPENHIISRKQPPLHQDRRALAILWFFRG